MNRTAAEQAVSDFLSALGHAPEADPEMVKTPARVVAAFLDELLTGYGVDVQALIRDGSSPLEPSSATDLVIVRNIDVVAVCPHHLLPAVGRATVAYLPGTRLLGLGALAALVNAYARRFTFQEAITSQVTQALVEQAGARGAYCHVTMIHGCLSARGERQHGASVDSSSVVGELASPGGAERLLLGLGGAT